MEPLRSSPDEPAWYTAYAKIRPDSYVMLAALLGRPPSAELLQLLEDLQWDGTVEARLSRALHGLREAGRRYSLAAVGEEFDHLFVGLGCGEMVPYASWYREKMIQSLPLAALRRDLDRLGITRQPDCHESEDHAGALCEIMAILCRQADNNTHAAQAQFFTRHLAPWMMRFFQDLQSAKSAGFYRAVGVFGNCFMETESEFLTRPQKAVKPEVPTWKIDNRYKAHGFSERLSMPAIQTLLPVKDEGG